MTVTRIVAELDYLHDGPSIDADSLVTDFYDHLSNFAAGYPGLELFVIGFAEANGDADEPSDSIEEDVSRRG